MSHSSILERVCKNLSRVANVLRVNVVLFNVYGNADRSTTLASVKN